MDNDFNVDIVNHRSGEVYAEGLLLAAAHIKIAKNGWKLVEETSEEIPGDGCGGGEGPFTLRTLWIRDPEGDAEVADRMKSWGQAAEWWDYENGGGRVHQ